MSTRPLVVVEETPIGSPQLRGAVRGQDVSVLGPLRSLAEVGRLLLVVVATAGLVGLAVVLIVAGLLSLLGFAPGDVARLSPPGRAAALAEFAVTKRKG